MPSARILVFAGSIRTGALSAKLAAAAGQGNRPQRRRSDDHIVHRLPAAALQRRHRNGKGACRRDATKLAQLIAANQGVFVSTPEYNHSVPPLLTNAIAWISRLPATLARCPTATRSIASAARRTAATAGHGRSSTSARFSRSGCRGVMIPLRVELPMAQHAFNESGELIDEGAMHALKAAAKQLVDFSRRLPTRTVLADSSRAAWRSRKRPYRKFGRIRARGSARAAGGNDPASGICPAASGPKRAINPVTATISRKSHRAWSAIAG